MQFGGSIGTACLTFAIITIDDAFGLAPSSPSSQPQEPDSPQDHSEPVLDPSRKQSRFDVKIQTQATAGDDEIQAAI